jgi:hypothetical protein
MAKDLKSGKQVREVAQERKDRLTKPKMSPSAKNLQDKDAYKEIPGAKYGPTWKK